MTAPSLEAPASDRRAVLVPAVALLAWTLVIWQGSLSVPFVYDDHVHLVNNPGLQAADATVATALASGFQETRPLYNLTLFALVRLGATSPWPFHLLGLTLHLVAVLLVFALARRLFPERPPGIAAFAAALFALHPLQAETVCYVNSLSGLLSATLYLAALLGLAPGPERRRPRLIYGLSLLAACGALLAKESAATLPLAVLLLDLLFHPAGARLGLWHFGRRHALLLALPLVGLPVIFMVAQSPHRGMAGFDTAPLGSHLLTQLVSVPRFIGLWLWPAGQALIHQPSLETSLWGWPLAGAAALAGLVALALRHARREPAVCFGVLFFLLALAPTNSLLPLEDFFSERFLYLPLAGLSLAAAGLLDPVYVWFRSRTGGRFTLVAWTLLALIPLGYGAVAALRVQVWQDPIRLWSEAVLAAPRSSRARVNLARELGLRGQFAEALAVVSPAVDFAPDEVGPRLNRAAARLSLGDATGAVEDCAVATELTPNWVDAWECLIRAALARPHCPTAEHAAEKLRELAPEHPLLEQVAERCPPTGDQTSPRDGPERSERPSPTE